MTLGGAIRSAPEDRADVLGLLFSEKAYLLAMRDYRPRNSSSSCSARAHEAARRLIAHYSKKRRSTRRLVVGWWRPLVSRSTRSSSGRMN
jgi:hypothetical protein